MDCPRHTTSFTKYPRADPQHHSSSLSSIIATDEVVPRMFFNYYFLHSNKSTNQMHQSLRFIACRLNTAQQHCYHHVPTVNQRRLLQLIRLVMMGMRMPETCWAVFKRQAINLRDCCIWLVDLFEYMMMHGLTNPEFKNIFL